jgi:hypothetical protein
LYNEFDSFQLAIESVCRATKTSSTLKADSTMFLKLSIVSEPTESQTEAIKVARLALAENYKTFAENPGKLDNDTLKYLIKNATDNAAKREEKYSFQIKNAVVNMLIENKQELIATNNMEINSTEDYKNKLKEILHVEKRIKESRLVRAIRYLINNSSLSNYDTLSYLLDPRTHSIMATSSYR